MKLVRCSVLIGAFIIGGASNAQTDAKVPAGGSAQEPAGYILIEETVVTDWQASPLMMLDSAKLQYKEKNFGHAASNLRTAAAMMRIESKRTSQPDRASLEASATSLDKLANEVQDQKVKSEADFDRSLADAAQAKARHHHLLAAKEWAAKEYKRAGYDLKAAADATERSAKWTGGEIARGTKDVVAGARDVSGKLIVGAGWGTAEVGKAIDSVGTEVERIGRRVEPERATH